MFADLILAGFIATAGGWHAPAYAPRVEPAVIRSVAERADRETGQTMIHLAADLGCPRYRGSYHGDYRGYPRRCRPRHADPYHDERSDRYSRPDDEYRRPEHHDRHGERYEGPAYGDDRYSDSPYRGAPGDRLRDRHGRPYSHSRDLDDDVPPYRRGTSDPGGGFDRFRDSSPRPRSDYYQRSSYHDYDRKKKDTTTNATMTTGSQRPVVSDAGLTV